MNTQARRGFTIIEVMLFLAVTGALTAGILIGSSAVIGQQRYRDSVNSFKSVIQEQYGQVTNAVNNSEQNPACSRADDTVVFDEDAELTRGTSDCLLMGKFMLIEPTKVTSYSLVGQPSPDSPDDSDTSALQSYGFATRLPEERPMAWGARVVRPGTTDGSTVSVLIVRSPLSGSILTYVTDGDYANAISDMISDGNMVQKEFCIDSEGMSGMGNRLAVRLQAKASSPSAVEIPLEMDGVCE